MCVCCCSNECVKWFLDCISSSSTLYPSSRESEELLFGVHASTDEKRINDEEKDEHTEEKLEHIRAKREYRLRATSLLNASYIINSSEDMFHQNLSHNRKQLFNGHGYNLALYKGHVRGIDFVSIMPIFDNFMAHCYLVFKQHALNKYIKITLSAKSNEHLLQ